jgi:deazaflavin-dependent oxidoreductase (nitroreductase family)
VTSFDRAVIAEFRTNGGVVGGFLASDAMMILTVTSARSGKPRAVPLVYGTDGERFIVNGSNGGSASDPLWYRDLQENPHARVEVGSESFEVFASTLRGAARKRAWDAMVAATPRFAGYQAGTTRELPVVALTRVGAETGRAP